MIKAKLLDEIKEYCNLNKIENLDNFVNKLLRNGFNVEKYGNKPAVFEDNTPIKVLTPEPITQILINEPEPIIEPIKINKKKTDIYGE
jgi:pyruvate formate-lyase activating enzyme-like uncharacterized protein